MFSGLVEELGTISANAIAREGRLSVAVTAVLSDVGLGDSIAVNGCCLTVIASDARGFVADVMPETGRRTNLGALVVGDGVNVEGSLRLGQRIGGHMVTGHVDGRGEVLTIHEEGNARWVRIVAPIGFGAGLVAQGCIAVDGISLTVVLVEGDQFAVSLIPHTLAASTAGMWHVGSAVNLESDLISKYVRRAVGVVGPGAVSGAMPEPRP